MRLITHTVKSDSIMPMSPLFQGKTAKGAELMFIYSVFLYVDTSAITYVGANLHVVAYV
mgnify:CR=1